jgi:glutamyl-Q tRNA(Asp) synthetase
VYVWGLARALEGKVLLRMEDHDRGRSRPEYEKAILEDLDWLGLVPDLGRPAEFRAGPSPYRQSDRAEAYAGALRRLALAHRVYGCSCSRKEIASESDSAEGEIPYSGRCRDRGIAPGPGRATRVVMPEGEEQFADWLLGEQCQRPSLQCGDLVLRDRLGNWSYQFAVAVDDMEQGVDLVIRGEDLLNSTGRQLRLARMLGRATPPAWVHHPLIRHSSGAKLSKANRDTGIRELRAAGMTPAAVLGRAAHLGGLQPEPVALDPEDLPRLFRWD